MKLVFHISEDGSEKIFQCCGCFGPIGGTANYCDTNCNAINGGTVIGATKIYTWVWVRPSLPKRVWNRCMEYQSQDENGQLEWFTLVGDSTIPEKVRFNKCNQVGAGRDKKPGEENMHCLTHSYYRSSDFTATTATIK